MRWFAGLLVVFAAILGGLFAIGYFVLPNTLDVRRSVQIERPRATVFAQVNDLRIAKEWSPVYAADPAANYTFSSDEPGDGQTMRWSSTRRELGAGEQTIIRSMPPVGVDTIVRLGDRAAMNADLRLRPPRDGRNTITNVVWRVSAVCQPGAINVPCRYVNLLMSREIERNLALGLARLKTMSEQLPDVDFEGLEPEFVTVAPQPYLYSPVSVSLTDDPVELARRVGIAMELGRRNADRTVTESRLVRAGSLLRVTTQMDDERIAFRIGYPFSGPAPLALAGEEVGQTPSGPAMRVTHAGPRSGLSLTYARAYAYLRAHHIQLRDQGFPWEVVLTEAADAAANPNADVRIELYYPVQ
ncbi:MAG: SRPBCC family protein [Hyphomonadaceae bacterium]|nr:SRPBCC family protein [Hyphomonadaceae bacterium]